MWWPLNLNNSPAEQLSASAKKKKKKSAPRIVSTPYTSGHTTPYNHHSTCTCRQGPARVDGCGVGLCDHGVFNLPSGTFFKCVLSSKTNIGVGLRLLTVSLMRQEDSAVEMPLKAQKWNISKLVHLIKHLILPRLYERVTANGGWSICVLSTSHCSYFTSWLPCVKACVQPDFYCLTLLQPSCQLEAEENWKSRTTVSL